MYNDLKVHQEANKRCRRRNQTKSEKVEYEGEGQTFKEEIEEEADQLW
jgi:hypothetical protein